jgi:hypothetical protein
VKGIFNFPFEGVQLCIQNASAIQIQSVVVALYVLIDSRLGPCLMFSQSFLQRMYILCFRLKKFSPRGKLISGVDTGECPYGMALIHESDLVVTHPRAREFVFVTAGGTLHVTGRIKTPKSYFSLASSANDGVLAAVGSNPPEPPSIDLISFDGEVNRIAVNDIETMFIEGQGKYNCIKLKQCHIFICLPLWTDTAARKRQELQEENNVYSTSFSCRSPTCPFRSAWQIVLSSPVLVWTSIAWSAVLFPQCFLKIEVLGERERKSKKN